jgi:hypothetical protein
MNMPPGLPFQSTLVLVGAMLLAACTVTEKGVSEGETTGQGGSAGNGLASAGQSARSSEVAGSPNATASAGHTASVAGEAGTNVAGSVDGRAGQSGSSRAEAGAANVASSAGSNSFSGSAPGGTSNSTAGAGRDAISGSELGGASNIAGGAGRDVIAGSAPGGATNRGGSAGSNAAVSGASGQGGASPIASIPTELVGVWQQTRASSGDYTSSNGTTFSLTSGFSVQLKLSSNGAYYLANFGSGVAQTCTTVTHFEQSVGQAALLGNTLVFSPTNHALDVTDCSGQKRFDLGTAPFTLTISLEEAQDYYGGIRTYRMLANGGPHPYDLMLLHRPPLTNPAVPAQPPDFTLGSDGPYQEFQGLWVAATGTDSNFFNPTSGEFYFPPLNGSPHAWLRMAPEGYETAIALQNVNSDGPCKSDVIYYEQGEARFAVLEDVGGQGNHFVGHARLQSTAARIIVRIRECGENDGTVAYDLPPLPRYFRFIYFSPEAPPERITFPCDFPLDEWQSILCEAFPKGFYRR